MKYFITVRFPAWTDREVRSPNLPYIDPTVTHVVPLSFVCEEQKIQIKTMAERASKIYIFGSIFQIRMSECFTITKM